MSEMPSKLQQGLNILKAGTKALAHTIKNQELPITTDELAAQRFAICNECPYKVAHKKYHRCTKCGCFLEHKTKVKTETCPLEKW